jgi:hypothetical protein
VIGQGKFMGKAFHKYVGESKIGLLYEKKEKKNDFRGKKGDNI